MQRKHVNQTNAIIIAIEKIECNSVEFFIS